MWWLWFDVDGVPNDVGIRFFIGEDSFSLTFHECDALDHFSASCENLCGELTLRNGLAMPNVMDIGKIRETFLGVPLYLLLRELLEWCCQYCDVFLHL